MKQLELSREVLGRNICAVVTVLDDGINVLLTGGEWSHVGAVTCASPHSEPVTIQLPHHKEALVSKKWASELASAINAPVCVECGIHYDNATKEQIAVILAECDAFLIELIGYLLKRATELS